MEACHWLVLCILLPGLQDYEVDYPAGSIMGSKLGWEDGAVAAKNRGSDRHGPRGYSILGASQ